MTTFSADKHNQLVAVLHLVHGFVAAVSAAGVFLGVFLLAGFKAALGRWVFPLGDSAGSDPELWVGVLFVAATAVYAALALLFTVPAFAGGYGLLKRRRWARKFVVVAAAVAALNFPFGTALSVYTFWFLLGSRAELKA